MKKLNNIVTYIVTYIMTSQSTILETQGSHVITDSNICPFRCAAGIIVSYLHLIMPNASTSANFFPTNSTWALFQNRCHLCGVKSLKQKVKSPSSYFHTSSFKTTSAVQAHLAQPELCW
jgi:hypothetical protein